MQLMVMAKFSHKKIIEANECVRSSSRLRIENGFKIGIRAQKMSTEEIKSLS